MGSTLLIRNGSMMVLTGMMAFPGGISEAAMPHLPEAQDALGTAGETPARLWHFYRLPTFGRSLYGCGALQLIPRELLSFSSSLERLEQHYGKQLPVREAL